jgi:hypothetical protein
MTDRHDNPAPDESATKLVIVFGDGPLGEEIAGQLGTHCRVDYFARSMPEFGAGTRSAALGTSNSRAGLDELLRPVDLVVVATDERTIQRHVAEQARALDIPAVIPRPYADQGGEVFVQLGPEDPCFVCWDGFRPANPGLRDGDSATDTSAVVQLAIDLCRAVLAPASSEAGCLTPTSQDPRPRQLFIERPGGSRAGFPLDRNHWCPACGIGPDNAADITRTTPD